MTVPPHPQQGVSRRSRPLVDTGQLEASLRHMTKSITKNRVQVDCPRSGPGQVRRIFSRPGPGPPGPVQLLARPEPGPHWTGSTRAGPGSGQVQTRTRHFFS